MAFRRSVTSRAKILYQQQRVAAPFSHIDRHDSDRENLSPYDPIRKSGVILDGPLHRRPIGAGHNMGSFCGSRNLFQDRRFMIPAAYAPLFLRNMSTFGEGAGAGADKLEIVTDVADVLGEKAVEAASQVVNEVAIAAADSYLPVAALQYVIGYVHTFSGLDWWASIVVATLLIRTIQFPFTIHQIKSTAKVNLMKPQLEEIQKEMKKKNLSPAAVADIQARTKKLYDEYGVTPLTPLKGILIVGPVFFCFFLALNNMVEKVPSFKDGGALWFSDLTTPDALFILPVLTALTFWITVECNAQEGMAGNPMAKTMKNISRGFAALTIPLTASFPKAIFCYWITSNLYSLAYGLVIKKPEVKKMLGIPDPPPPPPPPPSTEPTLSFYEALKYLLRKKNSSLLSDSSEPLNQRVSSASVLNQRIRSLEKEVKGKKNGKKRSSRR